MQVNFLSSLTSQNVFCIGTKYASKLKPSAKHRSIAILTLLYPSRICFLPGRPACMRACVCACVCSNATTLFLHRSLSLFSMQIVVALSFFTWPKCCALSLSLFLSLSFSLSLSQASHDDFQGRLKKACKEEEEKHAGIKQRKCCITYFLAAISQED